MKIENISRVDEENISGSVGVAVFTCCGFIVNKSVPRVIIIIITGLLVVIIIILALSDM